MANDLSQLSPVDTCVLLLDFSALIDDADPSLFFRNLISLHFPDTTFSVIFEGSFSSSRRYLGVLQYLGPL